MSPKCVLLAAFALLYLFSGVYLAWRSEYVMCDCQCPHIPGWTEWETRSLINMDCPDPKTCGKLVLQTANGLEEVHIGTEPKLELFNITSVEVIDGTGCFYLYQSPNYRDPVRGEEEKVCGGDRKPVEIPVIKSIEFFSDSDNSDNLENGNRLFFGLSLGLSTLVMLVVLVPEFKAQYKKKTTTTTEAVDLEAQPQREGQDGQESQTNTQICYRKLWSEIWNWRANIQQEDSRKALLLGLLPSALDVSSDYSYAKTWNDQGFNTQIRALVYAFIALPHAVTLLRVIYDIPNFVYPEEDTEEKKRNKMLLKGTFVILFFSLLGGLVFSTYYLIWHHPDIFPYIATVSALVTVAFKAAGVFVRGTEAKKALVLLTAR